MSLERQAEVVRMALSDVGYPFKEVSVTEDEHVAVRSGVDGLAFEDRQRVLYNAFRIAGCPAAQVPFEEWVEAGKDA